MLYVIKIRQDYYRYVVLFSRNHTGGKNYHFRVFDQNLDLEKAWSVAAWYLIAIQTETSVHKSCPNFGSAAAKNLRRSSNFDSWTTWDLSATIILRQTLHAVATDRTVSVVTSSLLLNTSCSHALLMLSMSTWCRCDSKNTSLRLLPLLDDISPEVKISWPTSPLKPSVKVSDVRSCWCHPSQKDHFGFKK